GVAAGSEATDAVNVAQLKALDNKVTDKLKDAGGVHYFSVKSGKPANTAGTNWDNDGATGQDAVAIGNGAIARVDGGVALGIGSIASIDKGVNGYDPFTGKASIENSAIWKATHAAFSVGSTVDKNHLITRQITGVAAGTQDTDAVNVAQLRNVATTPLNFYFGGTKDKTTNVYTPGTANWSMPLNEFRMDFGDGLKAEQVTDKDGNKYTRVTLDKDSLKNDSAFKGDKGADGANGKSAYEIWKEKSGNEKKTQDEFINEMKGKDGAKGADGANGKSAYEIWKEKSDNKGKNEAEFLKSLKGKDGKDGTNGTNGKDGTNGTNGKSAYEIWKEKSGNETKTQDDFINDMKGKDGANVEAGDDTIIVDKKDPAKAVLSLNKNLKSDSVKVGTISLDKDKGIDAGGKKITGIAAGEISQDSKDAVNGSQLFAMNRMAVNNMNQINNLRDESREGDAMGAAIASLKPLDFDPYQRSQVMAGVGYYRGKEAVALGLAHYKNEDLMIHGGLAYAGNSNVMANVGVSYRFGSSEDKEAQKARNLRMPQYDKGPISSVYILQDEVQSLKRENDAIRKENKEANDRIAALEAKLEKVLEKVK
uniref:YadA-like family protein n=1 Tax=uncultured Megasphaera sp. TaxID=165188 RepID=UPI002591B901